MKSLVVQTAYWISLLGHPFVTIPIFIGYTLFVFEPFPRSLYLSLLMVGGVCIPVSIRTYRHARTGRYTNLDVSDRQQRKGWYVFPLLLLLGVTLVLYLTHQSRPLVMGTFLAWLLLLGSQVVNHFLLKSSLHVAFNTYLAFLWMTFSLAGGIFFLCGVGLIGWSRVVLHRHTPAEVLAGALLGMAAGLGHAWIGRYAA